MDAMGDMAAELNNNMLGVQKKWSLSNIVSLGTNIVSVSGGDYKAGYFK